MRRKKCLLHAHTSKLATVGMETHASICIQRRVNRKKTLKVRTLIKPMKVNMMEMMSVPFAFKRS